MFWSTKLKNIEFDVHNSYVVKRYKDKGKNDLSDNIKILVKNRLITSAIYKRWFITNDIKRNDFFSIHLILKTLFESKS